MKVSSFSVYLNTCLSSLPVGLVYLTSQFSFSTLLDYSTVEKFKQKKNFVVEALAVPAGLDSDYYSKYSVGKALFACQYSCGLI
jgi:hypothetical protein